MFTRSPRAGFSSSRSWSVFSTPSLSPVRALSFTFRLALSMIRPSAGTRSPASSSTMSPTVTSREGMLNSFPSRSTRALGADMAFSPSRDFSALTCWTVPKTAFIINTARITRVLSRLPVIMLINAATSSTITSISANWDRNTINTLFFFFSCSWFKPWACWWASTWAWLRPD